MATERICDDFGSPLHPTQKPIELLDKLILGMSDELDWRLSLDIM